MKIALTHVYNESYLLKWWIPHHKKRFDHGVIVDYNSTDGTRELVKQLAPDWEYIQSRNAMFGAEDNTLEMTDIEWNLQKRYPGAWMISLTATEFFIGDTSKLAQDDKQHDLYVACDIMVSSLNEAFIEPDPEKPLIEQRFHGIPLEWNERTKNNMMVSKFDTACIQAGANHIMSQRMMRALHNFSFDYIKNVGAGRHAWKEPVDDFRIFWYGYSPLTEELIKRKLQVQTKIPKSDVMRGMGISNILDRDLYLRKYKFHLDFGLVDLRETISRLEGDKYLE